MPKDPITGAIDHVRLLIEAIVSGRVEAREVQGMSDEQLEAYITRLRDEAHSEVDRGYKMHDGPPQPE